ncbi:hypothetical protein AnigIFM63326_001527 [Aspergillus niger]|nr:hypothetical protein AnigIFM63326_001527 [Aspergillus niger]
MDQISHATTRKSENQLLWYWAQNVLQEEKDWQDFEAYFRSDEAGKGIGTIDEVLSRFRNLQWEIDDEKWVLATIMGKKVRPRDVVDTIVGYARDFKDIGATIAGADPTQSASLAWGVLQFFVALAVNNKNIRDLVENQEVIARIIYKSSIYVALYLKPSTGAPISQAATALKKSILEVYICVLKYLMNAWKFAKQHKWQHALSNLALNNPVNESWNELEKAAKNLVDDERVAHAEVTITLNDNTTSLDEKTTKLLEKLSELEVPLTHLFNWFDASERDKVLDWISQIRFWTRREELDWMEGTGVWFLNHDIYKQWKA